MKHRIACTLHTPVGRFVAMLAGTAVVLSRIVGVQCLSIGIGGDVSRVVKNTSLHRNSEDRFGSFHCGRFYSGNSMLPRFKRACTRLSSTTADVDSELSLKVNLLTIHQDELELLMETWGHPKYRAKQVLGWVRERGLTSFDDMNNVPKKLRADLKKYAKIGSLTLAAENISKDGTRKRAYELYDGQLIESVLMPYDDGRNTACISSQAGCAMGCVFCATGQMGFARQLSPDEIYEQVARFASELRAEQPSRRLSNVVFMGMGEPLANYKNVMAAIGRIGKELGIGSRKITVSTVGLTPNIRKLYMDDDAPPVKLAVSLHCASDEERSKLLPANKRYGGLEELMSTVREYTESTKRRMTFEWALIEGENDSPEVARELGKLIKSYDIRPDMVHINLIPLNPTGGFGGSPSSRKRVERFVTVLNSEFNISATPRMRRGIDIDAGCGQLKAQIQKNNNESVVGEAFQSYSSNISTSITQKDNFPQLNIGVFDGFDEVNNVESVISTENTQQLVNLDDEESDFENPEYESEEDLLEVRKV